MSAADAAKGARSMLADIATATAPAAAFDVSCSISSITLAISGASSFKSGLISSPEPNEAWSAPIFGFLATLAGWLLPGLIVARTGRGGAWSPCGGAWTPPCGTWTFCDGIKPSSLFADRSTLLASASSKFWTSSTILKRELWTPIKSARATASRTHLLDAMVTRNPENNETRNCAEDEVA